MEAKEIQNKIDRLQEMVSSINDEIYRLKGELIAAKTARNIHENEKVKSISKKW